jgi:hypothetical protein
MRETRLSGSEGGARFNPLSLPLSLCRGFARSVLQSVRILAGREDFGPRAVPARSTPNRKARSELAHGLSAADPLRPGTGRGPFRFRLRRSGKYRG